MKRKVIYTVLAIVIVALIVFNVVTVRRVSERPEPAEPPELNEAPVRVYGIVEPAGKPVSVSPPEPGVVDTLLVAEGDTVSKGQVLCVLFRDVQRAGAAAAGARIELGRTAARISADELRRNEELYDEGSISESEYTRLRLQKELDERQVSLYEKEYGLALARIEQLEVEAPAGGIIYLCDIREGEYFAPGMKERIVMGPAALQVRCDVEVLWIDRLDRDAHYEVLSAETGEPVGTARWSGSSRYLRAKRITTEDPQERLSARFQEVIMELTPLDPGIPIRLPVMVRLSGPAGSGGS